MSKTILTVDDALTIRKMVSFTLKSAGYEVLEAADGVAGLQVLKARHVDMIIIGKRGAKGLMKLMMGEVVAKVIKRASCKVLVVPKEAVISY